jgi:hypothetical protein
MGLMRGMALAAVVSGAACAAPGGSAPTLRAVDDQVVAVGGELVILLEATDPEGDRLRYRFSTQAQAIQQTARLTRTPGGQGVFRWTPTADDVGTWHVDFDVRDGTGSDTVTTKIEVRPATGASAQPVFRKPLGTGTVLDPASTDCVELDVEVQDQDSTSVEIAQQPPRIEGAMLERTGGLTAKWRWCPTAAQIESGGRYPLTLSADDGEHEPAQKEFLIVLHREPGGPSEPECTGSAPVVQSPTVTGQTVEALQIDVQIRDDQGLASPPLLYFTTEAPSGSRDLDSMRRRDMRLVDGDMQQGTWRFRFEEPQPLAASATEQGAEAQPLHYAIVAQDADGDGACAHSTSSPDSGTHRVQLDISGAGETMPEEPACEDDASEDDDNAQSAREAEVYPSSFVSEGNVICPEDPDWYAVELYYGETLEVDLSFTQQNEDEDLDVYVHDESGTNQTPCCSQNGQSATSDEHLSYEVEDPACATGACTFHVVVEGYRGASNGYDIEMQLAR